MYRDLPFTAVAGFAGTIGDFVNVAINGEGHATEVVINPNGKIEKTIDDKGNAVTYLYGALNLFKYRVLRVNQHMVIDVTKNIGFTGGAGVVKSDGWRTATADGPELTLWDAIEDKTQVMRHAAINTMLQYRVVIKVQDSNAQGLADYVLKILNAKDAEEAASIREEAIDNRRKDKAAYNSAKGVVATAKFERPDELNAVIDDVYADIYTLPIGTKVFAERDNHTWGRGFSRTWDNTDLTVEWFAERIKEGRSLKTEARVLSEGLLR